LSFQTALNIKYIQVLTSES